MRWDHDGTGGCASVSLDPLPRYTVPTVEAKKSTADILRLGRLTWIQDDTENVLSELRTFVDDYRHWTQEQQDQALGLPDHHRPAAERITDRQSDAVERMHEGITLLEESSSARDAFRLAMSAMHEQMLQSNRAEGHRGRGGHTPSRTDVAAVPVGIHPRRPHQHRGRRTTRTGTSWT